MHAIPFQLAVLPLTMSRLLVSTLSSTYLSEYIPFNEMTKCHIALGYALVLLVITTTVIFICGDVSFCSRKVSGMDTTFVEKLLQHKLFRSLSKLEKKEISHEHIIYPSIHPTTVFAPDHSFQPKS